MNYNDLSNKLSIALLQSISERRMHKSSTLLEDRLNELSLPKFAPKEPAPKPAPKQPLAQSTETKNNQPVASAQKKNPMADLGDAPFEYDRQKPASAIQGNLHGIIPQRKGNVISPYEDQDSALFVQQQNIARQMNRNFAAGQQRQVYETLIDIAQSNKQQTLQINEDSIIVTPVMAKNIINLHEKVNIKNKKLLETRLNESSDAFYKVLQFAVHKI